ncbi:uncharacterized protein conserved in bacteria [Hahella chejuensis KCTC 2396]|uniref:Uncharacterized protein conserved in bacteria n=1 Tax=Hahella chejuensis (strain KCTC 2396) TaxID=349521 RepID=Q2SE58_HAHCH|nr:DUF1499 domain-containing protein [Hahella chejuensis]ABC31066.1 uncharacterized protein conserved in bacteria [Hahella chejuensis KCTC 2396]
MNNTAKWTIFFFAAGLSACGSTPPAGLGAHDGRLSSCPESPNCVSSFSDPSDAEHFITPLYNDKAAQMWERLPTVLESAGNIRIIQRKPDYIRAEATSFVFRFVDDVEFLLDREAGVIHLRSASRLGYRDFGVNRERLEEIKAALLSE